MCFVNLVPNLVLLPCDGCDGWCVYVQSNSFFISSRLLSNGILTPKEGGIGIPPELLSSKKVLTPERVPGMK